MNPLELNELHKIWLKFLNTTKSGEGELWLDIFLAKYLQSLNHETTSMETVFSFGWKCSGNILAHQLLSDIYQICETVKSLASNESEDNEPQVTEVFKKYILDGRGWKLLWTLENIGIQTLLCLVDLVKLLIVHFPVIMTLPVGGSNAPVSLKRKPLNLPLELCFENSKKNKQSLFTCISGKYDFFTLRKKKFLYGRKRMRKKKYETAEEIALSSSEEDQLILEPCIIPATQLRTFQKVGRKNSMPEQNVASEKEESGYDFLQPDPALLSYNIEDFECYTISVTDYVSFIIRMFQECVLLDKKGVQSSSFCSPSILEFSLVTLQKLHKGQYKFDGWSKNAVHDLRIQLLKLIFLSTTVTTSLSGYTGAPNENETLTSLFTITSDILFPPIVATNVLNDEDITFVYDVAVGAFMVVQNIILNCDGDYAKVICIIRTFSSMEGLSICCSIISALDKSNCSESSKLIVMMLSLIKDNVLNLKSIRASDTGKMNHNDHNHSIHINELAHHESDIFGPPVSHSVINTEPMCCVATMSNLLLKLFSTVTSKTTMCDILKHIKACGICCCINSGVVVKTFFSRFSSFDCEIQHDIFILLEKYLFCQLGLTSQYQKQCSYCSKRIGEPDVNNIIPLNIPFEKSDASNTQMNALQKLKDNAPFWSILTIYNEMLNLASTESVKLVAKHLIQLFAIGIEPLKTQMFFRVILPQFLLCNSKCQPHLPLADAVRIDCLLSVLPSVLIDFSVTSAFVCCGGMPILYQFALLPEFRLLTFNVLEVLITSEYLNLKNQPDLIISPSLELSHLKSLSVFCEFLLDHTDASIAKLKTYVHNLNEKLSNVSVSSGYDPDYVIFLCDIWTTFNEVSQKLEITSLFKLGNAAISSGYKLLLFLLENFRHLSHIEEYQGKSVNNENILILMQNLLGVFLNAPEEIPLKEDFLNTLKQTLICNAPGNMSNLNLLLDMFLKCSLTSSALSRTARKLEEKTWIQSRNRLDDVSSSDEECKRFLSHSDCYDGDSEESYNYLSNAEFGTTSLNVNLINHGKLVKLGVELLIHFQAQHLNSWSDTTMYAEAGCMQKWMQKIIKLCQECKTNKILLCNEGLPSLLLKGFSESLSLDDSVLRDFQISTLQLFGTLAQYSSEAFDFKQIISFFKAPSSPMEILLQCLNNIIDDMVTQPVHSLAFPVIQTILTPPTSKSRKRLKTAFTTLSTFSGKISTFTLSSWASAAVLCPLTEDSNWNAFKKGFGYMLWIKLNEEQFQSNPIQFENSCDAGCTYFKSNRDHLEQLISENQVHHIASIGSIRFMFEMWCVISNGDIIIRITIYNNGTAVNISEAILKSWMKHGTWQHLALNYNEVLEKGICNCKVQIVLDGIKESSINLKYRNSEAKNLSDIILLLGHSLPKSEEKSTIISYSLGSFMFFKEAELTKDVIFYFASLGPDVTNITDCAVQKSKTFLPKSVNNQEKLNSSICLNVLTGLKAPSLKHVQNSLLCVYAADKPNDYLVYPHNARGTFPLRMSFSGNSRILASDDWSYQPHPVVQSVLPLGSIRKEESHDFQYAIYRAGGITGFLFLFAHVLEISATDKNQASALQLLLKLINKNTLFYEDFMRIKGDDLLFQLISNNCTISVPFVEVFLNNCLNHFALKKDESTGHITVESEPNIIITNPQIFILMVKSVLFAEKTSDDVVSILFTVMDKLLFSDHPNLNFNLQQITSVETLDTILWLLKKKYLSTEGKPFSPAAAKKIPPLIEKLLNCKFDVLVFQSICHFLVLLHKASSTFVCHSRSAFFFLFPQNSFGSRGQKLSTTVFLKKNVPYLEPSPFTSESLHEIPQLRRSPSYHGENFDKLFSAKNGESLTRRVNSEACISLLKDNCKTSSDIASNDPAVVDQENIAKTSNSPHFSTELRNNSFSSDNDGIGEICTGFLSLIQNVFHKVSDKVLETIMTFMQPEIFIILSYNSNSHVRTSAIKVIHTYLQFAKTEKIDEFFSLKGFHLLANQLHQLPSEVELINVCFKLASGHSVKFDFSSYHIEGTLSAIQVLSWIPIFALLPTAYHNTAVCRNVLSYLNIVIHEADSGVLLELINNGLFEFLAKLVFNISHSLQRDDESDLLEKNDLLLTIGTSITIITNELFSSKQSSHFSQLQNMLNLFTALERRCTRDCGAESQCVTGFRACQCTIYLASLGFSKFYCFNQMDSRSEASKEEEKKFTWDALLDISEAFPTFVSVSAIDVVDSGSQAEPDQNLSPSTSSIADFQNQMVHGIEKAKRELPMADVVGRLQVIISAATDFVVFKDLESKVSQKEEEFFKVLFSFAVQGLTSVMDKNRGTTGSKYMSFMWSLKDCLKVQVSRLLLSSLALPQNIVQREFTLEVLSSHPLCKKILHLVIFSMSKASNLLLFLHDLQNDSNISTTMRKNLIFVYDIVKDLLQDTSCINIVKDTALFEKLKSKWPQLWNQDRWKWLAMTNSTTELALQSKERLAQKISVSAMDVTKKVFDIQNIEWKKFVEELKISYYNEASLRLSWNRLSEHMTHERALWHMKEYNPSSWELDPTEGPFRIRRRLRRCHLNMEPRFLMPQFEEKLLSKKKKIPFVGLLENHCGFSDSAAVIHRLHSNEQIEYNCPCKVITAFEETKAEILIGDCCLHIIGEKCPSFVKNVPLSETCPFNCIKEILLRRFELQNYAFEIFMNNGLTFLIAFQSGKDLENIWKRLEDHNLPCRMSSDVHSVTQLWRDGTITNFEYITQLNKLAGRSFNDLMQYPVFPFILADYANSYIDIQDSAVYRNFYKPSAIQHKYREQYFTNTYNWLKEQTCGPYIDTELPFSSPYHYGSHYSNSGIVLSFLIRLLPFTYGFITYQDNNFDIPDRTFHSMQTCWELVTKHSTSDVKELIPEFFFLPEFLCNREGFDFGVRQTGVRVNDVLLPPWCKQNPRLFILIHRQALESDFVANNLHNWIDLVFGYKQTGDAAINAINVFHPATYFGLNTDKWKDPITRQAVKAMIKTIGQMPRQLFLNPHPMISMSLTSIEQLDQKNSSMSFIGRKKVIDTVDGLKWGNYVGSPSTSVPSLVWRRKQSIVLGSFLTVLTNDVFGLGQNICLLLNHKKDDGPNITSATYILSAALVSWGHKDGIVRIKLCRDQPSIPLLKGSNLDPICLCASVPDCKYLFVAYASGKILIYDLDIDSMNHFVSENNKPLQLNGHCDAVTSIFISKAFSIFVTAGKDKDIIIWDLNRLNYVISIRDHCSAARLVCVSNTLGDIASVSNNADGSCLKIHTINGELVGSVQLSETITAICYSSAPEGVSVNVVATGLHTGTIRLWSSWDLKPVREIKSDKFLLPIKCLTFSVDNQHLYAANKEGTVAVWEKPSKGLTTVPRLLLFT